MDGTDLLNVDPCFCLYRKILLPVVCMYDCMCIRDPDPGPGLFFFLSLCCFCIVSAQELVQIIVVSAVPPHVRGGLTLDKTRQQDRLHSHSQWTTSPLHDDSRRQHALLRPTRHGRLMTSAPR